MPGVAGIEQVEDKKLRHCNGKCMYIYIYKSKELWRGPESIYILKHGLCVAHDRHIDCS
jgi:hypothetical protein